MSCEIQCFHPKYKRAVKRNHTRLFQDRSCNFRVHFSALIERSTWKKKFKHEDSVKAVTVHYQLLDFYVQRNNIQKPSDQEDELITLRISFESSLTHFSSVLLLCRDQPIHFYSKPMNWFLHNCNTGQKWLKDIFVFLLRMHRT